MEANLTPSQELQQILGKFWAWVNDSETTDQLSFDDAEAQVLAWHQRQLEAEVAKALQGVVDEAHSIYKQQFVEDATPSISATQAESKVLHETLLSYQPSTPKEPHE